MAGLRAIDLAISASVDSRPTLEILLHHALTELGADAATILKLNPYHQLEPSAWQGFSFHPNTRIFLDLNSSYAGKAVLEGKPVSLPDISLAHLALLNPALYTGDPFNAYHAIPLVAKGQTKGVLEVFHRRPFSPDDGWLEYLQALASQAAIAIDNGELFENLQRSNQELSLAYDATIEGWSYALDLRDRETEGHTRRVVEMTIQLARRVGISEEEYIHVRRGALLHDIGKMGIPDYILHKPEPLTEQEWEIMRMHPVYAFEMLSSVNYLRPALDIPYCHHEYWNGNGYPRKLKGEQIPLKARIFSLVDVWDALNSERPYRPAWPKKKVREYIRDMTDKQFDPSLVKQFFQLLDSRSEEH
jgi:HD-GYP domain-containing protein (c-di-GMP phosphodiesterase class II)